MSVCVSTAPDPGSCSGKFATSDRCPSLPASGPQPLHAPDPLEPEGREVNHELGDNGHAERGWSLPCVVRVVATG